jgi:hypothetical protein
MMPWHAQITETMRLVRGKRQGRRPLTATAAIVSKLSHTCSPHRAPSTHGVRFSCIGTLAFPQSYGRCSQACQNLRCNTTS